MALAFLSSIVATVITPATVTWYGSRIGSIRLSWVKFVKLNFAMRFYTVIMPRGIATGIRWVRYQRSGRGDDALALMIFQGLVEVLISLAFTAAFLGLDAGHLSTGYSLLWCASLVALACTVIAILPFFNARAAALMEIPIRLMISISPGIIATKIEKLWSSIVVFQRLERIHGVAILAISVVGKVVFIWSGVFQAYAMGIDAGFLMLAWVRSVAFLLQMIPVTIAGIGVREASFIALLGGYGIAREEALTFSLALFFLQILIAVMGAVFELYDIATRKFQARTAQREI